MENSKSSGSKKSQFLDRAEWWDILSSLMDILQLNLFVLDNKGGLILPSEQGRFGGRFLTGDRSGFDINSDDHMKVIKNLEPFGEYFRSQNPIKLNVFAIPIGPVEQDLPAAYLFVGPVILGNKNSEIQYVDWALENGVDQNDVLRGVSEVRVLEQVVLESILNLLAEIVRGKISFLVKQKAQKQADLNNSVSMTVKALEQEIYSGVYFDEFLISFLDTALRITETDSGSIMMMDEQSNELVVKFSRGVSEKIAGSRKRGASEDGLARLVLAEGDPLVISSEADNERIKHLLKRKEIKQSLVMPLSGGAHSYGVLNLNSFKDRCKIEDHLLNLQYLSKLLSAVS